MRANPADSLTTIVQMIDAKATPGEVRAFALEALDQLAFGGCGMCRSTLDKTVKYVNNLRYNA